MTSPFEHRTGRLRSLLRRLRRDRAEAALAEIRQVLDSAERVRDVHALEIEAIAEEWHVDFPNALQKKTLALYRDLLRHYLADHRLSDEELAELDHLRRILHLDRRAVELTHRRAAREAYSRSVEKALADATIDEQEREFLTRLREMLGLPEAVASNIEEVKARQREARNAIPPKRAERS